MAPTDTTPLQERIARALCIEASEQEDGAPVWGDAEDLAAAFEEEVEGWERFAAAVLPIIAAEVRAAKAAAWDEGCAAAEQYYKRTAIGVPGSDPIPAPLNPHKTGDSDERR